MSLYKPYPQDGKDKDYCMNAHIIDREWEEFKKEANKKIKKAAIKFASNNFPDKSSFEFSSQYESFLAGAKWAIFEQKDIHV